MFYSLKAIKLCFFTRKMIDFNKELNKEQSKVVYEGDGPCLVLSGPGSGKTRTLVYRAAYLLEKGVPSDRILLLTFTKKAAEEMLSRIKDISPDDQSEICGGTFHHAGNLFLREFASKLGYSPHFIIIDKEDSKSILSDIIKKRKEEGVPKAPVVQSIISLAVNSKKRIEEVLEEQFSYLDHGIMDALLDIHKEYEERKKDQNLMDYDDLLLKWRELLEIPDVLKVLSERFLYILIDEYQDTNLLQDEIVHKMSSAHGNILVVGDDSQSIYSFRAANIDNILKFSEKHSGAKIFKLETNYRSTFEILDMANNAIMNNRKGFPKELKSVKGEGNFPCIIPFSGEMDQARYISNYLMENDKEAHDTAILFRAHFHSVELELELARKNVPYTMRGGMKFVEQFHVKDLMAFLRIFLNFRDESSLKRLFLRQEGVGEVGSRQVIDEFLKYNGLQEVLSKKKTILDNVSSSRNRKTLERLFFLMEEAAEKDIKEKISVFRNNFYDQFLDLSFDNAGERKNDLKRIEEMSLKYDSLERMVADFSLSENFKKERENKGVTLSTIHQAKGLEWKNVFVISLKEGDFPHSKAIQENLIEEERRLFYVAITRCKENLFLTYPTYSLRERRASSPSRFLREIDPNQEDEDVIDDEIIEEEGEWEAF